MPKVLIVDDSVSVRKALERILMKEDLDVVSADGADQALRDLTGNDLPDLIIADVVMPGMDGFELCQVLKANDALSSIPVILISGIVNDSVQTQAEQVGAVDVLKKPFNPADLMPTVRSAVSGRSAPALRDAQPVDTAHGFEHVVRELQPFLEKSDIESVLLISAQGDCLLNLGRQIEDNATVASYFKFFASAATVMGERLKIAPIHSMLLEFEGASLMLNRISEDYTLALALHNMTVQSVARFLIKKQLPLIKKALASEAQAV
ncbi:response regulator [soil metagenome]